MTTAADPAAPTPGWMVAVLGVLLLPLAAGAFILSFEQLWPVMLLGGWSTSTAWLGPIVLDITASSGAVMHVVSSDQAVKRWGLGLLLGGTVLSIAGNLAGHNIRTADGASRAVLPPEMTGWALPDPWQTVVLALSIAAPTAVAVLVHAFGAVFKAWLTTRPSRVESADPTPVAHPTGTRPDPLLATAATRLPDPTQPAQLVESAPDSQPTDPTRPAPDSLADLRKSAESGTQTDPTGQVATRPEPQPTSETDRPDSDPTQPTEPTRPAPDPTDSTDPTPDPTDPLPTPDPTDPESATRPAESDLDELVDRARRLVESGQIRPTADAIRPALGVGSAKAREIRDALKGDPRHGLRAVS